MAERSNKSEVRNPVLALPGFARLTELSSPERAAIRAVLVSLSKDARERADKCWRTHKAPMAVYWKAVAVYSGHIARAISRSSPADEVRAAIDG